MVRGTIEYNNKSQNWGYLSGWGKNKLIEYILNLSSESSSNITKLILKENYYRINSNFDYKLDNVKNLKQLEEEAHKIFDKEKHKIIDFFDGTT